MIRDALIARSYSIASGPADGYLERITGGGFLTVGLLDEVVLAESLDLKKTRAYLCGDPTLVGKMRRKLFIKGLSSRRILADAFIPTAKH